MNDSVSVDSLRQALGDYGTWVREFSASALLSNDRYALPLLAQLGDPARLSDGGYRLQLAEDVVSVVVLHIATIGDRIKRLVAEAALATKDSYFGVPATARKTALYDEHRITEDIYKSRRTQVLSELAAVLVREFRGGSRPLRRVCIAGDSVAPELGIFADTFGWGLVDVPVKLVSGYAAAGQRISAALVNALKEKGMVVDGDRITQIARSVKGRSVPAGLEGALIIYGQTQEEKRRRMLQDCDLLVLFGGGPGTAQEARIAESFRIPVLPLPSTGGTALWYWQRSLKTGQLPFFGGHRADPLLYRVLLGHENHEVAVPAALALVKQAVTGLPADPCATMCR